MPEALREMPVPEVWSNPPRRHWTREERERLEGLGLLNGERWELVEGELLRKMPKKRRHVEALAILTEWLMAIFGGRFVNAEAPIDVAPEDNPTSEPEPDLIVLRPDYGGLWEAMPGTQDVLLAVEVSDTTFGFDSTVKAGLYARAGLREYWLVDLNGRRLIVHRSPAGGRYQSIVAYGEGEQASPLAAPEARFEVGQLFGEWESH
jgi:Uma2 family endonuclease